MISEHLCTQKGYDLCESSRCLKGQSCILLLILVLTLRVAFKIFLVAHFEVSMTLRLLKPQRIEGGQELLILY